MLRLFSLLSWRQKKALLVELMMSILSSLLPCPINYYRWLITCLPFHYELLLLPPWPAEPDRKSVHFPQSVRPSKRLITSCRYSTKMISQTPTCSRSEQDVAWSEDDEDWTAWVVDCPAATGRPSVLLFALFLLADATAKALADSPDARARKAGYPFLSTFPIALVSPEPEPST